MNGTVIKIAPGTYRVTGNPAAAQFRAIAARWEVLASGTAWGPFTADELADMPAIKPYNVAPVR